MEAYIFPGQGTVTKEGVSKSGLLELATVTKTLEEASEYARINLIEVLKAGSEQLFSDPKFSPLLTVALECALWDYYRSTHQITTNQTILYGISVGEIAMLYANEMLSLEDTIRLTIKRSEILERTIYKGKMMSVPGIEKEELYELLPPATENGLAEIAVSYTLKWHVVAATTGYADMVFRRLKKERGGTRILQIPVLSHITALRDASEKMQTELDKYKFSQGIYRVTTCSKPYETKTDIDRIIADISEQICTPLELHVAISHLYQQGVNAAFSVSPDNGTAALFRLLHFNDVHVGNILDQ